MVRKASEPELINSRLRETEALLDRDGTACQASRTLHVSKE